MSSVESCSARALPFKSREQMIEQAGKLGLVELVFTKASSKSLFAHHSYLMASSGVLRGILDAQDDPVHPAKVARTADSADVAAAAAAIPAIPLDDDDTDTWELALALLYPSTMTKVAVTWEKVQPLLQLADKYDIPAIAERVKAFLITPITTAASGSQLKQGLQADNVFCWLSLFSRRGWGNHVEQCIDFIVQRKLKLPKDYLVDGPQPQHVQQLYEIMRDKFSSTDSMLKTEERRPKPKVYENAHCTRCYESWYYLLSGRKPSPFCIWCGVDKIDGYESEDSL